MTPRSKISGEPQKELSHSSLAGSCYNDFIIIIMVIIIINFGLHLQAMIFRKMFRRCSTL